MHTALICRMLVKVISRYMELNMYELCVISRWHSISLCWPATRHCQSEDADFPGDVSQWLAVLPYHPQAGGYRSRPLRWHHSKSSCPGLWECSSLHGVWTVPARCHDTVQPVERVGAEHSAERDVWLLCRFLLVFRSLSNWAHQVQTAGNEGDEGLRPNRITIIGCTASHVSKQELHKVS